MVQILWIAIYLTIMSFCFLTVPIFEEFLGGKEKLYTAYFVLFILGALFNAFNVRDDGFAILGGLRENPDFLRVWVLIVGMLVLIVNAALIPVSAFGWLSAMFSCTPFSFSGWILVFVLAATLIPIDMVRKLVMRE